MGNRKNRVEKRKPGSARLPKLAFERMGIPSIPFISVNELEDNPRHG